MLYDFLVLMRALCTGGTTVFRPELGVTEHAEDVEFVQSWRLCQIRPEGNGEDAYTELVGVTVEDGIVPDLVRGEGWADVQLTVLDKKILIKCGGHFKFVIADRGHLSDRKVAEENKQTRNRRAGCQPSNHPS